MMITIGGQPSTMTNVTTTTTVITIIKDTMMKWATIMTQMLRGILHFDNLKLNDLCHLNMLSVIVMNLKFLSAFSDALAHKSFEP